LGVYADMLATLPTEPPRVSRHYKFVPGAGPASAPSDEDASE